MSRRLVYAACLLASVCCLTAMPAWPEAQANDAAVATPATPKATESPATPFAVKIDIRNLDKGWLTRLTLSGEFKDAAVFDKGVMIRGQGSTVDASGKVLCRNVNVELEIAPTIVVTSITLDQGTRLIRFAEQNDLFLHLEPTKDGSLQAIGAGKSATAVVSFELPPALVNAVTDAQLAAFSGTLFAHLGGIGPVECSPTFSQCLTGATETCANYGGVKSVTYACNISTGAASCEFECLGSGGDPNAK